MNANNWSVNTGHALEVQLYENTKEHIYTPVNVLQKLKIKLSSHACFCRVIKTNFS